MKRARSESKRSSAFRPRAQPTDPARNPAADSRDNHPEADNLAAAADNPARLPVADSLAAVAVDTRAAGRSPVASAAAAAGNPVAAAAAVEADNPAGAAADNPVA